MVAAAVIYGARAVLFTWSMVLHLQTGVFGGGGVYHHLWGFWWFDNAIRYASTMWSCPLVFHPSGANLVLDDWPLGPNLLALIMRRFGLTLIGS
jgi:hypothetical protein